MRRNLKGSHINIGEDLPKRVQEIRKSILLPAMKKVRNSNPKIKASVIGDKLIVNGKHYLHYDIPAQWLDTELPNKPGVELAEDKSERHHSIPESQ